MTIALLPPPQDDEEAHLLAAIQASPDDDGLRLVYADHLLRRGDPRGELYAIQHALERGVGPWQRFVLEEQASELSRLQPQPRRGMPIYRRGAPDGSYLDPREIDHELPAHLQLMVWSTTSKTDAAKGFARLRMHARASDLRELDLGGMRGWGWEVLVDGALRPRRLVLPRFYGRDADRPPHGWMDAETVGLLHDAPLCQQVETLELSAAVGDAAFAALARAPWMANVTSLVAGGVGNYGTVHGLGHRGIANGPLGDAGVRVIAQQLPALRRLDLRWNRVTAEGVRALADSGLALDELRLSLDGLGVAGLAALARSRLAGVARVWMGQHEVTEPAAYRALLESPLWAERWVDLWVDKGFVLGPILDAIASARDVPPIDELRIRGAKLDFVQLDRLLASPAMASLKRLALVELEGTVPASAFFGRVLERPLEGLHVERCHVGAAGLEAALASPHAAALELLHLEECMLGDVGVQVLARSAVRPVELEVEDRTALPIQLELLASPVLARTERLRLFLRQQFTAFDSASVRRVLSESPHLANVRKLSLQGLEKFAREDHEAILQRFGAALYHPRYFYK